ncbi:hypothetical protein K491DRAFT_689838 [Lophiostoma macrostomum CBS 122681]|uniref:Uncharacterized protein n=1 Tax=Lophiostoma macrostomum CBS 122681 TaxID=1314788 RepID=A0A6A6TH54_9PLEO|nr:hypothetical protein K491DRAFT_689838 [Lophiostoma macrostomum CBS 122681]
MALDFCVTSYPGNRGKSFEGGYMLLLPSIAFPFSIPTFSTVSSIKSNPPIRTCITQITDTQTLLYKARVTLLSLFQILCTRNQLPSKLNEASWKHTHLQALISTLDEASWNTLISQALISTLHQASQRSSQPPKPRFTKLAEPLSPSLKMAHPAAYLNLFDEFHTQAMDYWRREFPNSPAVHDFSCFCTYRQEHDALPVPSEEHVEVQALRLLLGLSLSLGLTSSAPPHSPARFNTPPTPVLRATPDPLQYSATLDRWSSDVQPFPPGLELPPPVYPVYPVAREERRGGRR